MREKIKKVILPNSLSALGRSAFGSNYNLREFVIPSSIKEISLDNFYASDKLRKIYICNRIPPVLVSKYIDKYVKRKIGLDNSINVDTISGEAVVERKIEYTFKNMGMKPHKISLYVPKEAVKDYQEADLWKEFDIKIGEYESYSK